MKNLMSGDSNTASDVRVWYVDDSDTVRELLVEVLRDRCGLSVARNFSCPHAMLAELRRGEPPDVVLMDVNLANRESGVDMIQPTLRASPSTRVVMITTFSDRDNKNQAMMAGASAFLLKTEPPQRIVETIHRVRRSPHPPIAQAVKPAREHGREPVREPSRDSGTGIQSKRPGLLRHVFGWRRASASNR
jgi:DNA-binding NarL/FixJ family response regulator